VAEALRKKLAAAGYGSEGTLVQLRARWRVAEMVETARTLAIAIDGRELAAVRHDVLTHYRQALAEHAASPSGSLAVLKARLERYLRRRDQQQQQPQQTAQTQQKGEAKKAKQKQQ